MAAGLPVILLARLRVNLEPGGGSLGLTGLHTMYRSYPGMQGGMRDRH